MAVRSWHWHHRGSDDVCGSVVQAFRLPNLANGHDRLAGRRVDDPAVNLRGLGAFVGAGLNVGVLVDLDGGSSRQEPAAEGGHDGGGLRPEPRPPVKIKELDGRRIRERVATGGKPDEERRHTEQHGDLRVVHLRELDQGHVFRVHLCRLPLDAAGEHGGLADRGLAGGDPIGLQLRGLLRRQADRGESRPMVGMPPEDASP